MCPTNVKIFPIFKNHLHTVILSLTTTLISGLIFIAFTLQSLLHNQKKISNADVSQHEI